jgi:hypothetical protein
VVLLPELFMFLPLFFFRRHRIKCILTFMIHLSVIDLAPDHCVAKLFLYLKPTCCSYCTVIFSSVQYRSLLCFPAVSYL